MATRFGHPLNALEPDSLIQTSTMPEWQCDQPDSQMLRIQLSQAISLRRIADTLERVTDHTFNEPAIRTRGQ